MSESEQRRILDRLLEAGRFPKEKRVILRECYLQKNRVESAAEKLRLSVLDAELWYTAFSLELALVSLNGGHLPGKKNG